MPQPIYAHSPRNTVRAQPRRAMIYSGQVAGDGEIQNTNSDMVKPHTRVIDNALNVIYHGVRSGK
jgi:hypothetical protein